MKNKPCCPKCESKNVYFRLRVETFVCRICGYIWKKEKTNGK
jgi:ribosomal protein L37AE/L43A